MAKQRRPSRPTRSKERPRGSPRPRVRTPVRAAAEPSEPSSSVPQRRTTYVEAVALYERGLDTLQRHDYQAAAKMFESVLRQYPEDKELHERVRLDLDICQRHAT